MNRHLSVNVIVLDLNANSTTVHCICTFCRIMYRTLKEGETRQELEKITVSSLFLES